MLALARYVAFTPDFAKPARIREIATPSYYDVDPAVNGVR